MNLLLNTKRQPIGHDNVKCASKVDLNHWKKILICLWRYVPKRLSFVPLNVFLDPRLNRIIFVAHAKVFDLKGPISADLS